MSAISIPTSPGSLADAPQASAVGWGAIVAGAVAAIATNVILLALGAGIGLTAASPFPGVGASAKAIGAAALAWMIVVQWLSAAMGGYVAGRLRIRWNYFDQDEVFFRDTTHGFLAWGVAVTVTLMAAGALATGVAGPAAAGATASAAQSADRPNGYFTDRLFRGENPNAAHVAPVPADRAAEAERIVAHGLAGELPQDDRTYLVSLVADRTGMSREKAQERVDQVIGDERAAADNARKAAAALAIGTALSLAIGAFIAAVAAGWAGRLRDE